MLRKSGSAVRCVVTQWSTVQSGGPSDQAVVLLPLTINNLVSVPDCVTLVRLCHNNLVSVPDCVTQHSHSKWGTIEGSGVITLQWCLLTTKLPRPGTWDWWSLLGSIKTFTRWLWTEYCDPAPRSPWRQWSHIVRPTLCPDRKISLALLPSPWLEVIQVEDDLGGSHATASASDDSRQHEGVKRQADRVSVQDLLRACPPQVATQTEVS